MPIQMATPCGTSLQPEVRGVAQHTPRSNTTPVGRPAPFHHQSGLIKLPKLLVAVSLLSSCGPHQGTPTPEPTSPPEASPTPSATVTHSPSLSPTDTPTSSPTMADTPTFIT